jgi:hypothetical protein
MNNLRALLSIVALSFTAGAWAAPFPESQDSSLGFRSFDLPAEQTGTFEVSFDAMPLADKIDCFTGISAKVPVQASDVAAIVRFNDSGKIDVRNGNQFRADQALDYSSNKVYRVRMVINVASRTYSVFVTAPGQPEVPLAKNYLFRSQQSSVTSLGQIVLAGFKDPGGYFNGAHRVARVSLKAVSP